MYYCSKCNQKNDENSKFCGNCGAPIENCERVLATFIHCSKCYHKNQEDNNFCGKCGTVLNEPKGNNFWFGVLSVLEPVLGLIFFCAWNKNRPRRAKACGISAIVSVVLAVALGIVSYCIGVSMIAKGGLESFLPAYGFAVEKVQYAEGAQLAYDENTDAVIAWERNTVTVYERGTKEERFDLSYVKDVSALSAYGGRLAVGVSDKLRIYDLATGELTHEREVPIALAEIVLNDSFVAYCDGDQWCQIWVWQFQSIKEPVQIEGNFYQPALAFCKYQPVTLYAVDRGISSCNIFYISLVSNRAVAHSEHGQYSYNNGGIYSDGRNIHAFGAVFDAETGRTLSGWGYTQKIKGVQIEGGETLCDSWEFAVLSSQSGKTFVYDYQREIIVAALKLDAKRVYHLTDGNLVILCDGGMMATIDMGKIV